MGPKRDVNYLVENDFSAFSNTMLNELCIFFSAT